MVQLVVHLTASHVHRTLLNQKVYATNAMLVLCLFQGFVNVMDNFQASHVRLVRQELITTERVVLAAVL